MNAMTNVTLSSSIASRAMLVNLTISQWSARKRDKDVTDEVNSQHGATSTAGNYNKHLLPDGALDGIQKAVSTTRNEFLARTLPWQNDGSRIMAADKYFELSAWFQKRRYEFEAEVDKFLANYDVHRNAAQVKLGSMFKDTDYPTREDLKRRFGIDFKVNLIAASDDIRIQMSEDQANEIRQSIEGQIKDATNAAVKEIYDRVRSVAERMVDRLTAYKPATAKGEKSEGVFKDTLVSNVEELIDIMPALNITGDPKITEMAERMKALVQFTPKELREDADARKATATSAQSIIDQLEGMFA